MLGVGPERPILVTIVLVALSAVLFFVRIVLRKRGVLRGRTTGLVWALIVVAPLVAGILLYVGSVPLH